MKLLSAISMLSLLTVSSASFAAVAYHCEDSTTKEQFIMTKKVNESSFEFSLENDTWKGSLQADPSGSAKPGYTAFSGVTYPACPAGAMCSHIEKLATAQLQNSLVGDGMKGKIILDGVDYNCNMLLTGN